VPVFFQQEVNPDTRLAVWQIIEPEAFFDVPLQRSITHPHKRLQHLAGRYLLRHLFADFPLALIQVADTRKPFLEDEAFHFSISHCGDFAAAIASRKERVGIDIEIPSGKVERIRHKFLAPEEEGRLAPMKPELAPVRSATLAWSAKEAAFKWYGKGGVDFRHDMPLQAIRSEGMDRYHTGLLFRKELHQILNIQTHFLEGLCLSYVCAG
jgi:phosphopantetheinyl transferase